MKALLLSLLSIATMPIAFADTTVGAPAPTANEVRFVQTSDGRIELHQDRGPCQSEAKRAAYVPATGDAVLGCWVSRGGVVAVVFFDGDVAHVPVAVLKKTLAV